MGDNSVSLQYWLTTLLPGSDVQIGYAANEKYTYFTCVVYLGSNDESAWYIRDRSQLSTFSQ